FLAVGYPRRNGNADVFPIDVKALFVRGIGISETQLQLRADILPLKLYLAVASPSPRPPKHGSEKIGKTVFIKIARVGLPFRSTPRPTLAVRGGAGGLPGFFIGFRLLPVLSVLVVFFSFFRVAQDFIGFIDLL